MLFPHCFIAFLLPACSVGLDQGPVHPYSLSQSPYSRVNEGISQDRSLDISSLLVESLSGSCPAVGDLTVPHRALLKSRLPTNLFPGKTLKLQCNQRRLEYTIRLNIDSSKSLFFSQSLSSAPSYRSLHAGPVMQHTSPSNVVTLLPEAHSQPLTLLSTPHCLFFPYSP